MSERLSDKMLQVVEKLANGKGAIGATVHDTRVMAAELRERRQADLTPQDLADLEWAREMAQMHANDTHGFEDEDLYPPRRCLAVLDKLTRSGK